MEIWYGGVCQKIRGNGPDSCLGDRIEKAHTRRERRRLSVTRFSSQESYREFSGMRLRMLNTICSKQRFSETSTKRVPTSKQRAVVGVPLFHFQIQIFSS